MVFFFGMVDDGFEMGMGNVIFSYSFFWAI